MNPTTNPTESKGEAGASTNGPANNPPEIGAQSYEDRNGQHHPIAEFLYQLTKMLTDDNNEIIEWADGKIKVHHPERLEGEVLHKYFRHSKFASFQRQLNYFGFRKIAGKGKMSPCSYINEAATSDIRSLLLIKRKTNGSAARKAALQQRAAALVNSAAAAAAVSHPQLAVLQYPGLDNNNNAALQNAVALLSQNALRAGGSTAFGHMHGASNSQVAAAASAQAQLNLLALQAQQQRIQKQLLEQQALQQLQAQARGQAFTGSPAASSNSLQHQALLQQAQAEQARSSDAKVSFKTEAPSDAPAPTLSSNSALEQLQAQIMALQNQGGLQNFNLQAAAAALLGNQNAATLAATSLTPAASNLNRATAALAQQGVSLPATAAMDAAVSGSTQQSNNLFESAANLKSLLEEHTKNSEQQQATKQTAADLLRRLPSQSAIFPDNGLSNLLGSSNRLSSLLSLNSFLGSREPSLADFAAVANNVRGQMAANNVLQQQQQQQDKYAGMGNGNNV